jgi:cellulose synthase/poly-beta-1,6-N-acetylglucosamine synthase-like glycosyltransferase
MSSSDSFFDKTLHPKPWASMVMPIHSCRNTILKSLDGLDRQQVPWWCEVIFVLDTIKDDTLELVHNHPFNKKWEVIEISKPGRGLAEGYNIGWKAARSNLVFYMHGDCYPVADDAMLQMHRWLEKENAVAVMPLIDIPQGDWHKMSFWDRVTSSQFRNAKPAHGLSGKFDLIRRDALEKCGGFDEKRFFSAAEDADIVEQLNKVGKVAASDVLCIHAHLHPPESRFISVLRKQAQYGEGGGALIRKNVHSFDFLRRASVILALNFTKLTLLICLFIWPLTPYAAILLLLLSAYYGRWAMLSKDWRAPLVPFAVSLMFSINALSMVRGFIQGHQSFHYHKRNK